MKRLILASASPRRRELLAAAGFSFEICVANVSERDESSGGTPAEIVVANAEAKARAVAETHRDALVLGADTTVALGGRMFGKPKDLAEARRMLRELGGREHTVFTGTALVCAAEKLCESRVVACHVEFKPLDDETILRYFGQVNPLDKAGAYAIQEAGNLIIKNYEEPVSNIVGLPVEIIAPRLRELLET